MGEEEGAAPIPASQILGFLGLALAVFGITPVPSDLRLLACAEHRFAFRHVSFSRKTGHDQYGGFSASALTFSLAM